MRQTLQLSVFRDDAGQRAVNEHLSAMEPAMAKAARYKPNAPAVEAAKRVMLQATACNRALAATNAQLERLRASTLPEAVEGFENVFKRLVAQRDRQSAGYRFALYTAGALLAIGFVIVAVALRRLYNDLRTTVETRSRALAEADTFRERLYESNRLVLENVRDGLFTVDYDGRLSPELSSAAIEWFGAPAQFATMVEWLERFDPDFAAYVEMALEALRDDVMPVEVMLGQLPARLRHDRRTFEFSYRSIHHAPGGGLVLVRICEITAALAREEEERRQQQVIRLAQRCMADPFGAREFIEQTDRLLQDVIAPEGLESAQRALHSINGNAGLMGLSGISAHAHALEDAVERSQAMPTAAELAPLRSAWQDLRSDVSVFLPSDESTPLRVTPADVSSLKDALRQGRPLLSVFEQIDRWSMEPIAPRFQRLADQAQSLAKRFGRLELRVEIEADDTRVDPETFKEFWSACTHLIRNAVDHGIEAPQVRAACGKAEAGVLRFEAGATPDGLRIAFSDDGAGIDASRLVELAQARGIATDPDHPFDALFVDGVSMKSTLSHTGARGVGMGVVRAAAEALGGRIEVASDVGRGTCFTFYFPTAGEASHPRITQGPRPQVSGRRPRFEVEVGDSI